MCVFVRVLCAVSMCKSECTLLSSYFLMAFASNGIISVLVTSGNPNLNCVAAKTQPQNQRPSSREAKVKGPNDSCARRHKRGDLTCMCRCVCMCVCVYVCVVF